MPFAPREPSTTPTERPKPRPAPPLTNAAQILALQRTAGNAAVARLLRTPATEQEKRYDFSATIFSKPVHYANQTPQQVTHTLRVIWNILHNELNKGRGRHLELLEYRRENSTAGYWSDVFGDVELPDPDIWNEVGGGPLRDLDLLLKSTDAELKPGWEAGEAMIDRGLHPSLKSNPYFQVNFDATEQRIKKAVYLIDKAAVELWDCERRVDVWREGHQRGAGLAISGINVSIVVLSATAGGAGAGFAGEGAGIAAQAAAGAATAGALGAAHEAFVQVGEMRIGEREKFDVTAIAKRGARDTVTGFIGGVVGGQFTKVISNKVGGWVGRIPQATLDKHGIARDELLTNGEKLFIGWLAGNVASSPFTTSAGVLMDSAMAGKLTVGSWGDFSGMVFDDMVQSAALGGFLTYAGHALPPRPARPRSNGGSAPAARPAPKSAPVKKQAGDGPKSDGVPEPIHDDAVTPVRETRAMHDPDRKFAGSEAELRKNIGDAYGRANEKVADLQKQLGRPEGAAPDIVALVEEIRAHDPQFAADVEVYYKRLADPAFIEQALVDLWQAARRHGRTMAQELEAQLGGDKRGVNEFDNENTPEDKRTAEFGDMLQDPRVFIDQSFAADIHGSHTHAFQEHIGNLIWPPDGGRTFRLRMLKFDPDPANPGPKEPYWPRIWDLLFDAFTEQGSHSAEVMGRLLQQAADFPRWDPKNP